MSYYNYQFRTHSLQRMSKKVLGVKQSLLEIWRMIGEDTKESDNHMELWLAEEEFSALSGIPNYCFVSDLKTAQGIERATFQANSVVLENQIKFISWPKGYKIEGIMAKGCMVSVLDVQTRSDIHDEYTFKMKLPPTQYNTDRKETQGYVSINYESPHTAGMHCRLAIPFDILNDVIQAKDHNDMLAVLGRRIMGAGLTEIELKYQLAIAKACIKTLVYMQACPDKVTSGVPDKRAAGKQRVYGQIISGIDSDAGTSNNPHIVGYFFRQLRHEKYYKGEHRNKPHGSRWVFVKPHERGLNAETVKA